MGAFAEAAASIARAVAAMALVLLLSGCMRIVELQIPPSFDCQPLMGRR